MKLIAVALAAGCAVQTGAVEESISTTSTTSADGYLTLTMTSSTPSSATGINNTYTWSAHNNSTRPLPGVVLGSHWGDWCGNNTSQGGGANSCTPAGPTQISIAPGCSNQSAADAGQGAHFGVWCTPFTGITLAPGATVTGSVTLRPAAGGPPNYVGYSLYNDPVTGVQQPRLLLDDPNIVAPAPIDEQLTGSASTGSPAVGSTFSYNYQVKNAGPWGPYGNVTFTDTLPGNVTYVGVTSSPGAVCSAVGQTVTCTVFDLANQNGQQSTISITVRAPATAQQITNTANIAFTPPQTDSALANNTLTLTVASK